jgi:hypothetical protein
LHGTLSIASEAADCRVLAQFFKGRAEQEFLLRLAGEFDQLAAEMDWPMEFHEEQANRNQSRTPDHRRRPGHPRGCLGYEP